MNRDKVIGMFLGGAIGDALGMPVEIMTAEEIAKRYGRITEYIKPEGHKWYNGWEAGRWTDDTQLTLAIAESLIAQGEIDLDDIARRSIATMMKCSVGWGGSTKKSLMNIHQYSLSRLNSGARTGSGNGVAMKISPIAAFLLSRDKEISLEKEIRTIIEFTIMTHDSDMAIESALAQILAIMHCLLYTSSSNGRNIIDTIKSLKITPAILQQNGFRGTYLPKSLLWRIESLESYAAYERFNSMNLSQRAACFDGATCFVYNSLPFTYAMFMCNPHSIETLYDVVNAGGDTDTNGSMVGALLGALNGTQIFPQHLLDGLWQKEKILQVANDFCDRFNIA